MRAVVFLLTRLVVSLKFGFAYVTDFNKVFGVVVSLTALQRLDLSFNDMTKNDLIHLIYIFYRYLR